MKESEEQQLVEAHRAMEDAGMNKLPPGAEVTSPGVPAGAEGLDPGFWSIPNAFMKKVRKMTTNELRDKVHTLARGLMDQHNANIILTERLKLANEELKELRVKVSKAMDAADLQEANASEGK